MKKAKDMDLLDFFAAIAMHALTISPSSGEKPEEEIANIADLAYEMAWAMIVVRDEDKHG